MNWLKKGSNKIRLECDPSAEKKFAGNSIESTEENLEKNESPSLENLNEKP